MFRINNPDELDLNLGEWFHNSLPYEDREQNRKGNAKGLYQGILKTGVLQKEFCVQSLLEVLNYRDKGKNKRCLHTDVKNGMSVVTCTGVWNWPLARMSHAATVPPSPFWESTGNPVNASSLTHVQHFVLNTQGYCLPKWHNQHYCDVDNGRCQVKWVKTLYFADACTCIIHVYNLAFTTSCMICII